MPQQKEQLSLKEAYGLKESARRVSQLADAMQVLDLMDTLCIKTMELYYIEQGVVTENTAEHHPEIYVLLPENLKLDVELVKERGGVQALQSVLKNNFNVDPRFFTDNTFDELEVIIGDMFEYSDINNMFDIDYNNARFEDIDCRKLDSEALRQKINETLSDALPDLKRKLNIAE